METILMVISLCLKLFTLYFGAVALFALKRRREYPRVPPAARFAVVIAARNEENVICHPVQSVLRQVYPPHLRDVYVIANNCTDRTEELAILAGAEILNSACAIKCKGDALHIAFDQLMDRDYDAFIVLDADNTLSDDYLARVNDAIAAGARVFKTRTKTSNPTASSVAGCYGIYNTFFDLLWNRPRAACGLSSKVIGTGFGFTREYLEELGGWCTHTIAEDAEFSAQCAGRGERVWWVPEAVNYDEAPDSFLVSLRQRKRWCSGVMQVGRRVLPQLLSRAACPGPLRWDMAMFLLAPFAQAISALMLAVSFLVGLCSEGWGEPLLIFAVIGLYWAGGVVLASILALLGGYGVGRSVLLFPVFMAFWLPLQVLALFKDTRHWTPIVHTGCVREG